MRYKIFNCLKILFGTLLLQPSQMSTWMTFISFNALFFIDAIKCMKKFSHWVRNIWHCGKCDGEFLECDYRYKLKVDLEDITGHLHGVISFDDDANQLMGVSAKYLCLLSTEATSILEIAQKICNKQFLPTLLVRT